MDSQPSRQGRRRILSVTTRLGEGGLATTTRIGALAPTPSLMRLSTIHSPSGRRGRELRQFRLPSAHAPTLSPVVPRSAQGKASTPFSHSWLLWTTHESIQTSQLIVARYRRRLLQYTPQRRAGLSHKHFNLCILLLIGLHFLTIL